MINLKELETVYIKNKITSFEKMMNLAFIRRENPNIKIEILDNNPDDIYILIILFIIMIQKKIGIRT